jgi:hypothetical protein
MTSLHHLQRQDTRWVSLVIGPTRVAATLVSILLSLTTTQSCLLYASSSMIFFIKEILEKINVESVIFHAKFGEIRFEALYL